MKGDPLQALNLIAQALFDKKGFNILALDVRNISTLTDYFIIAEGNVDRHVKALAQEVREVMSQKGEKALHVEGLEKGDWVVLDYLEIVIHLFMPGMRDKYRLEELWRAAEVIDLNIVIKQSSS